MSASVGCPAELLMIQQQKTGRTLLSEAQHIVSQHGPLRLYKSLVSIHLRICAAGAQFRHSKALMFYL